LRALSLRENQLASLITLSPSAPPVSATAVSDAMVNSTTKGAVFIGISPW